MTADNAAARDLQMTGRVNATNPLAVRVSVHGDGTIGSLAFDRPWTYMTVAMSRDDLAKLRDAITDCLADTEKQQAA